MEEEIMTADGAPEKKKKKFGPVKITLCIIAALAVAALGVWAGIAFGRPQRRNAVDMDYGSVSYEIKDGEIFSPSSFVSELKERDENGEPLSSDGYDAIEVFGRLNWAFAQQDNWSSEMHSTVQTAVGPQEVATYKRFADGILISSDITTSSMVNLAREFCYVGDRVMWRDSNENKSQWDGVNTVFPTGVPLGNMNISGEDGFKRLNGLPATELSVYVIEANTVESAELNTVSTLAAGDELYTLTMHLIAKTDADGKTGAAAYYGNQMVFSGGIDAPPEFKYITVSYTFTEDWVVVSCDVAEEYTASMKTIVSTCSSQSKTLYAYDVEGLEEEVEAVFDSYYKQYAEKEATGTTEREVTAADCLASAFGPVLSSPTTLDLSLKADDTPVAAKLYLDLGGYSVGAELDLSKIEARLSVGTVLNLYLKDGKAYVRYSDVKLSMTVDELISMLSAPKAAAETEGEERDLLAELMGGEFTHDDTSARLKSAIELMGIPLELDFQFGLDADKNASLTRLDASCALNLQTQIVTLDSNITAQVTFGQDPPAALTADEKAEYTDIAAHAARLKDIFTSDVLRVAVDYTNEALGLSVAGSADLDTKGLRAVGDFTVTYQGKQKPIRVQYDGTAVYADVDGIKVKASNGDILTLLGSFLPPAAASETTEAKVLPLGQILGTVLGEEFAGNFASAAVGNALQLTIDGTALLKDLLPETKIGDITVTVSEEGLSLSVGTAEVSLSEGTAVTLSTDGYIEIVDYIDKVMALVEAENLAVDVNYTADVSAKVPFSIEGTLAVRLGDPITASGEFTLTVSGTEHTLGVAYDGTQVGVDLDGVKFKTGTDQIFSLISLFTEEEGEKSTLPQEQQKTTAEKALDALFSVKLDELLQDLSEEGSVLKGVISGDKLLGLFGVDFKLGDVGLGIDKASGKVTFTAMGATLVVGTSEKAPAADLSDYQQADDILDEVAKIVKAKGLALEGSFALTVGEQTVNVVLENGGISWKDGFEMRVALVLCANDLSHRIEVYANGEKVKLAYGDIGAEIVFADFEDLNVAFDALKAKVQSILDAVKGTAPKEAEEVLAIAEEGDALTKLIEKVKTALKEFGFVNGKFDFNTLISNIKIFRPETKDALIGVKLGGVSLELGADSDGIDATAKGWSFLTGTFTARASETPFAEMPKVDYIEIDDYVKTLLTLVEAENLAVDVNYTSDASAKVPFSVEGTVTVRLGDPITASGEFTLTVSGTAHTLGVAYDGTQVGVDLDGVKFKTGTDQIFALISLFTGEEEKSTLPQEQQKTTAEKALDALFSVKLDELLQDLSEEGSVLKGVISGDKLLGLFGVNFKLGDVGLGIDKASGKVTLTAMGATLVVGTSEKAPAADLSDYQQADDILDEVTKIVKAKGVALEGSFALTVGKKTVNVVLENGGISWKDGFEMRLALVLCANDLSHRIEVYANGERVKLAYGDIGAEIVFADFEDLNVAFDALKAKVQSILDAVKGTAPEGAEEVLAIAEEGDALTKLIEKVSSALKEFGFANGKFDLNTLISNIKIFRPETKDALIGVKLGGVSLELGADSDGIDATAKGWSFLTGTFTAHASETPILAMPEIDYLSKEEFLAAIDYLGSAVDLLVAQDYTFTVEGSTTFQTTEPDPETEGDPSLPAAAAEVTKTRYDITATMKYHNGAAVPVHVEVDKKNFWIETSLYLNVNLKLVAGDGARETDKSLYLDLVILDGAPEKEGDQLVTDGNLDIYLSLSQFDSGYTKYSPLNIYAPADEILTLLSSGVAALGLNIDLVDNYLVNRWLNLEEVSQLETFTPFISQLLDGLLARFLPQKQTPADPADPAPAEPALAAERGYMKYIKSFSITETELVLVLNSADVYGVEGLEDLKVTLTRGEKGFSSISFANVYDRKGVEKTDLKGTFDYAEVTPDLPKGAASYTSFLGAEKLLLALVKSATHAESGEVISGEEAQHTYALNKNFYIDGSIKATLNLVITQTDITIDIIAISITIDENGDLGINIRLEYQGMEKLGIVAINGASEVDLTIKNGMVYIKRVQKNYYKEATFTDWKSGWVNYETPITLYRAMPLSNFTSDILGQFGFILNFNEKIMNEIVESAGSSTDPAPEEVVDYGARLSEVLTNYTYTEATKDEAGNVTPAKWDLTLNGDALAKGILGDIKLTIFEDKDGYIRDLTVNMKIVKVITADLNLRWRNAGGTMEAGASDLTHDVSAEIESGMGAMLDKLNAVEGEKNGWDDPATAEVKEGPSFLEAKEFTVTFRYHKYGGGVEDFGTQTVFVSTGTDGNTPNILYSALTYPELSADTAEFKYTWESEEKIGFEGVLPADGIIWARETKQMYAVTFISDSDLGEGWEASDGVWKHTIDMEYGATITVGGTEYRVTDTDTVFHIDLKDVPARGARKGHWQRDPEITREGAKFIAEYEGDTVIYKSAVAFTAEGEDRGTEYSVTFGTTYTLVTPTAEGHTFLGWYTKDAEGKWTEVKTLDLAEDLTTVTVEALWAQTQYDFTLSGSSSWGTYKVTIQETEEKLIGAFASEKITRNVKREFYIGTGTPGYEMADGTEYSKKVTGIGVKANARVTVTYTDENGNVLYTIVVEKKGTYSFGSFIQS